MTRFDLHQHLWPELLIAGLIRRRTPPRIRCDAAGRWTVELRTSMLGAAVEHALLERNPQAALGRVAVAA